MDRVHFIIDEMISNGCVSETSKNRILVPLQLIDASKKWFPTINAAEERPIVGDVAQLLLELFSKKSAIVSRSEEGI